MSGTKYAKAVGAVRAMESSLLSRNDIDQLIAARSQAEMNALLASKRYVNMVNGIRRNMLTESYCQHCSFHHRFD